MTSRLVVAAALALSGCVAAPVRTVGPAPQASPTLAAFDRHLAPYGEWLFLAPHGRVWRPSGVASGWRPYLYGQWEWTDDGWFWDSDEPWGWAVYHYGRWVLDPTYGWLWVPGPDWAPAWVAWRYGDGFVGWAPLGPGVEVWWTDAYAYAYDPLWWVFVPSSSFIGVRVNVVALPPARLPGLFPRVRPAPPPGHGPAPAPPRGGPPRPAVERDAGRPVPPVRVVPVPTPDEARARPSRDVLPTYRPAPPPASREAPPPRRDGRDEKDERR